MVYIFMGPSCTGKSTAVRRVKEIADVEVFTGKDYLRMAKGESEAWQLFYDKLINASSSKEPIKERIIYLITAKDEYIRIKDMENLYKIKFSASIDAIKERFSHRMHGRLPQAVELMLERQYKEWEDIDGDITVDTSLEDNIEKVLNLFK